MSTSLGLAAHSSVWPQASLDFPCLTHFQPACLTPETSPLPASRTWSPTGAQLTSLGPQISAATASVGPSFSISRATATGVCPGRGQGSARSLYKRERERASGLSRPSALWTLVFGRFVEAFFCPHPHWSQGSPRAGPCLLPQAQGSPPSDWVSPGVRSHAPLRLGIP